MESMEMDLTAIIEQVETGEQDGILTALQRYNMEMDQCFTFEKEDEPDRQRLGQLLMQVLDGDLQPSCQLACLETVRILTRDKHCLDPFVSPSAMSTLIRCAGISVPSSNLSQGQDEDEPADVSISSDQDVIVEALKSISNILLHNEMGQAVAADLQLISGVAERLKQCHNPNWNHQVRFFDLRLTFLLTALRVDTRNQLAQELHGISLLGNQLDATLDLCWPDMLETDRTGSEGVPPEDLPPLSQQQTERAMEILKILFNITFDTTRRQVDEEEAAEYRHLGAILRHCLMSHADGQELTEEFHSHTVNLLSNLPVPCLDVLLMPKVKQGSAEYMGVNMDAVHMLLEFVEKKIDSGHKLKESLLPSLSLLTDSARIHRETRKFLRSKVLPPLRDVMNKPEVGDSLRNKLVRLMTHIDTDVKDCAAEFLFVLCKENVSRLIKYTGYGNAAGLLAARGLLRGGTHPAVYSDDEDSETEEYKGAKGQINPVTGIVEEEQPDPMEGMTEEQKEYEAMKLVNMFDKLSRTNMIQPMQLGMDGKMREISPDDLHKLAHNPLFQPEEGTNPDSEDEVVQWGNEAAAAQEKKKKKKR